MSRKPKNIQTPDTAVFSEEIEGQIAKDVTHNVRAILDAPLGVLFVPLLQSLRN